ncbi:MAG: hypothetical protein GY714_03395 [Desulfobacterales bacterium]|nr:hypothetical protein [Desulfobacterales bacterium]
MKKGTTWKNFSAMSTCRDGGNIFPSPKSCEVWEGLVLRIFSHIIGHNPFEECCLLSGIAQYSKGLYQFGIDWDHVEKSSFCCD